MMASVNFLIYDNRSGSTFLAALIDSIEEIGVTLEADIFSHLLTGKKLYRTSAQIDRVLARIYADRKFNEWAIPKKDLKAKLVESLPLSIKGFIHIVLRFYFVVNEPKSICWIYKGLNPYAMKKIGKILPDSKFIFVYRDGRAVFSSKKRSFSRNIGDVMERDPMRAARKWAKYFSLVGNQTLEAQIIAVKYEELISDTDRELKKLYAFLFGHDCNISSISSEIYHRKIPQSQSHLHQNVGNKPLKSRINAWKTEISPAEIYLYEKVAHSTLRKHGYDIKYYGKPGLRVIRKQARRLYIKLLFKRVIRIWDRCVYYSLHPIIAFNKVLVRFQIRL